MARLERNKARRKRSDMPVWATALISCCLLVCMCGLMSVLLAGTSDNPDDSMVPGLLTLAGGIAGIAVIVWFNRRSVGGPGLMGNLLLLQSPLEKGERQRRTQAQIRARMGKTPDASANLSEAAAAPVPAEPDRQASLGEEGRICRLDGQIQALPGDSAGAPGTSPNADAAPATAETSQSSQADSLNTEVMEELVRLGTERKGWLNRLAVLVVSVLVFIGLGLFQDTLTALLTIAAVILLHELGHYLAMLAFGYRDVSMFFIPMFGAAVSGRETDPAGWKRAVVSLTGPMPGLLAGLVLGVVSAAMGSDFGARLAITLVALNGFNLLPFLPLDGGRFLQDVLFCRNRHLEFAGALFSGLLLGAIALGLQSWFLGLMGVFAVIGAFAGRKEAAIAGRLRPRLEAGTAAAPGLPPPATVAEIVAEVQKVHPDLDRPRLLASRVDSIWRRLQARPPGCLAAGALLTVYGGGFFACLLALVAAVIAGGRTGVVEFSRPDGSRGFKEVRQLFGKVLSESEVSEDGLYHGRGVSYDPGTGSVRKEGGWRHGRWHGEWKDYDAQGNAIAITVFDQGHFVTRRELTPSGWAEKKIEDLPAWMRRAYEGHAASPPQCPGRARLPQQ